MESLRYPTGRFNPPRLFDSEKLEGFKSEIKHFPVQLKDIVNQLSEQHLETKYRPDGWTGRQVIHHLSDSHINSYIRYRWTLTENRPIIKAYDEKRWTELPDAVSAPVQLSIDILESIHAKWSNFLDLLSETDYKQSFIHPESGKEIDLYSLTALYAWHGKHHLGHLNLILQNS